MTEMTDYDRFFRSVIANIRYYGSDWVTNQRTDSIWPVVGPLFRGEGYNSAMSKRLARSVNRSARVLGNRVRWVVFSLCLSGCGKAPPVAEPVTLNIANRPEESVLFIDTAKSNRIIFVLESCISMHNKWAQLQHEMRLEIDSLAPGQFFNVIFLGDSKPHKFRDELVPASAENKHDAVEYIRAMELGDPTGLTSALKAAFAQKPETIYLLADGDFPDSEEALKLLGMLNEKKVVRLYTIAFTSRADDPEFYRWFQGIAVEHGGRFKHVESFDPERGI